MTTLSQQQASTQIAKLKKPDGMRQPTWLMTQKPAPGAGQAPARRLPQPADASLIDCDISAIGGAAPAWHRAEKAGLIAAGRRSRCLAAGGTGHRYTLAFLPISVPTFGNKEEPSPTG